MKLWVDATKPAPEGYIWAHSVSRAMKEIFIAEYGIQDAFGYVAEPEDVEVIDIDYYAKDFWQYGGDYIQLLELLEKNGKNYPIHIHTTDVVEAEELRKIIRRNGWKEI